MSKEEESKLATSHSLQVNRVPDITGKCTFKGNRKKQAAHGSLQSKWALALESFKAQNLVDSCCRWPAPQNQICKEQLEHLNKTIGHFVRTRNQ